jgi:hypothetical protein
MRQEATAGTPSRATTPALLPTRPCFAVRDGPRRTGHEMRRIRVRTFHRIPSTGRARSEAGVFGENGIESGRGNRRFYTAPTFLHTGTNDRPEIGRPCALSGPVPPCHTADSDWGMSERGQESGRVVDFLSYRDARRDDATGSSGSNRPYSHATRVLSDRQIAHRRQMLATLTRPRTIRALS